MDHVGPKTRSEGQIIEKPCEHFRGQSLCPFFIRLAQNDHLDNISVKFKHGSCQIKKKIGQKVKSLKNLVNTLEATVLVHSLSDLVKIEYGSCWVKN